MVQLVPPLPYQALVPPFALVYREPEEHLDKVVQRCLGLPGIAAGAVVGGVSYKDDTTLARFARFGMAHWTLQRDKDLGITDPAANIETIQHILTPAAARRIRSHHGAVDILVARHIVEHCADPATFIAALRELVRDGGYLVLEVPDCRPNLLRRDYTMVWDQHNAYFTPETFAALPGLTGFRPVWTDSYPLIYEPCLVQVIQKTDGRGAQCRPRDLAAVIDDSERNLRDFADGFDERGERLRAFLARHRECTGVAPALYGAGHLSSAFVTYHDLAGELAYVVDDTPSKQGRYMPGGTLEIVPSARLVEDGIRMVLLGLSPEVEDKVIAKNAAFVAHGGEFYSILCGSDRSVMAVC